MGQSFKYDHLRKEASDYKPWTADSEVEGLRAAIEAEVTAYALNHYRHGVSATFSKPTEDGKSIVCCIEDHQFRPKNYWNGRWRSQWTVAISGGQAEVTGVLKVQLPVTRTKIDWNKITSYCIGKELKST